MQRTITAIVLFLVCINFVFGQNNALLAVREKYKKAIDNQQVCEQFITENFKTEINKNVIDAYKACAVILLAKHSNNPYKKLQHFNTGKEMLEKNVQMNANNVEIRFLRLAVQTNLPKLLNYSSNIKEDKSMILKNLNTIKNDKDLFEKITTFLKSHY